MAGPCRSTSKVTYEVFQLSFTVGVLFSCFIFSKFYFYLICVYVTYKTIRPLVEKLCLNNTEPYGRGVFITGCDTGLTVTDLNNTGFGHKLAEYLDEAGFIVFAGCLDINSPGAKRLRTIGSKRISVLDVDVTSQKSIDHAGQFIQKHLPKKGLWAIVNNAGINSMGDVELTPVYSYEKDLAVNLYGPIRVCKQFLPMLRKSKGRVVNVVSVHGRLSIPRYVNYEVAKHGMETLSDSLRLEMIKFGVKVCVIEPGAFRTSIASELHAKRIRSEIEHMWKTSSDEIRKTYKLDDLLSFVYKPNEFKWPPGNELLPVVKAIEHAVRCSVPNYRYMVSGKANCWIPYVDEYVVAAKLCTLLPSWIMDEFTAWWKDARKVKNDTYSMEHYKLDKTN